MHIKFTRKEQEALLHRLSCWDCFRDVFADTEGLEHLAEGSWNRVKQLHDELEKTCAVTVDPTSEMDREVMLEAVEGNTWMAYFDPRTNTDVTPQKASAAYRTLCHIADKVSLAFDVLVSDIDIPTY